jgi:GAF domain-containing protein
MVEGNYRAQITDFARAVCAAADYRSALSIVAAEVCRQIGAQNVLIWLYDDDNRLRREAWRLTSLSIETAHDFVDAESGIVSEVLASNSSRLLGRIRPRLNQLFSKEQRSTRSRCTPARRSRNIGVIEAINKDGGRFTPDDAVLLEALSPLAAAAILARREQDQLSSGMLHAVTRLTQLYDVSQSFNSTIDLAELFPLSAIELPL